MSQVSEIQIGGRQFLFFNNTAVPVDRIESINLDATLDSGKNCVEIATKNGGWQVWGGSADAVRKFIKSKRTA